MCSGKLLKNVGPVCDTTDLHVSTLNMPPENIGRKCQHSVKN